MYVSFYLVHEALSYPGSNTMLRISTLQRHKIHRNPKGKQSDIERIQTARQDIHYMDIRHDMWLGIHTCHPKTCRHTMRDTQAHSAKATNK